MGMDRIRLQGNRVLRFETSAPPGPKPVVEPFDQACTAIWVDSRDFERSGQWQRRSTRARCRRGRHGAVRTQERCHANGLQDRFAGPERFKTNESFQPEMQGHRSRGGDIARPLIHSPATAAASLRRPPVPPIRKYDSCLRRAPWHRPCILRCHPGHTVWKRERRRLQVRIDDLAYGLSPEWRITRLPLLRNDPAKDGRV